MPPADLRRVVVHESDRLIADDRRCLHVADDQLAGVTGAERSGSACPGGRAMASREIRRASRMPPRHERQHDGVDDAIETG